MVDKRHTRWAVRGAVLVGLILCSALAVTGQPGDAELPGMALGSRAVLVAERTALLLVAWLALLVVVARAWRGELPAEVSGRGVKYAEAEPGQALFDQAKTALRRHELEIDSIRRDVADLKEEEKLRWAKWRY